MNEKPTRQYQRRARGGPNGAAFGLTTDLRALTGVPADGLGLPPESWVDVDARHGFDPSTALHALVAIEILERRLAAVIDMCDAPERLHQGPMLGRDDVRAAAKGEVVDDDVRE